MFSDPKTSASAVWFLVGPFDSVEMVHHLPIYTVPFVIGRREDLALVVELPDRIQPARRDRESGGSLVLRDLGSTNGTYVNGRRITGPVKLHEDDLVQFANMAFRVQAADRSERSAHTLKKTSAIRRWRWCSSTS